MATVGSLADQRQLILDRIAQLGGFYDTDPVSQRYQQGAFGENPEQLLLQSQLQGRAGGSDAPFTPSVISALLGQSSDALAGRVANESDLVRQNFANRGLGGSGLEASALVNSRRNASAQQIAGRRDITSRAQLENFQARAQAQQQLQGYQQNLLQQQQGLTQSRFGAQSQAAGMETDFRSRLYEIQNQEAQQAQRTKQQQSFMNRINLLAAQANNPGQGSSYGGFTSSAGHMVAQNRFAQEAANRRTASTQLNALLAMGPGY